MSEQKNITSHAQSVAASKPTDLGADSWTYRPLVDVFETGDTIILSADLPGTTRDDIAIEYESGFLAINAPVPARSYGKSLRNEYGVGHYHRKFEVGDALNLEGIDAEYVNGVLTVRIPKQARMQRRVIPIKG